MEIINFVNIVFGVTIINAIGLVIFWFIGKSVFTKALDTAAAKVLEDRRNKFTLELEDVRQRFSKELESERTAFQLRLESERREAAHALEMFKADLTLGAEIRRQVAQKKVAILFEIVEIGEPLIRRAFAVRAYDVNSAVQPFEDFMTLVRRHQYIFTKDTTEALRSYSDKMARYMDEFRTEFREESARAAVQASERFLDLIRSELGVE
ncbi:hypothetical protein WME99_20690 [Sorangium sp. So ce136]|uniref:hypothetical protein n=1 Tax=Sorangium sp. So ce136 TaxID=3133284 RepID=UPI003F113D54